jgi:hypothetical protein
MNIKYHTIKEIERMAENANVRVMDFWQENDWIVVVLSSNVKLKFRNY